MTIEVNSYKRMEMIKFRRKLKPLIDEVMDSFENSFRRKLLYTRTNLDKLLTDEEKNIIMQCGRGKYVQLRRK